jgi:mannose-6-phosphate isomerase-like protein (cupin superfamily)
MARMAEHFETTRLGALVDATAPDGSDVRILLRLAGGSMAHFSLGPRATAVAIRHRTISEIWYVLGGTGQMWRSQHGRSEIVDLDAGTVLTIPVGTSFQFRATSDVPFTAVGITMPPWPGDRETEFVPGEWEPTVTAGPA